MESKLRRWQLAGFAAVCVGGTLLHFLYDWSGKNSLVAAISAVNESTWEHMKLLFIPMFVFALVEMNALGDQFRNFWTAKLAGTLLGLTLIPGLYYTYTGAFGISLTWLDIAIFYVSAAAVYVTETRLLTRQRPRRGALQMAALAALWALALLFLIFTYYPPHIPLFRDPVTGLFGLGG